MNPDTPALVVGPAAGLGQSVPRRDDNADEKGGRNGREVLPGPSPSRLGRRGRLRLVWLGPFAACAVALSALAVAGLGPAGNIAGATSLSASSSSYTAAATTTTTYPAGKEQVCHARDQLKTSVKALTKPSLLVQGRVAIKAAVGQVMTNLNSLRKAAKGDYKAQVAAVKASIQGVESAVGKLGNGQVSKNLQAVGAAITKVGTTSAALFSKLKTRCGP